MAETVKNVVLSNSIWIEKFMHPLFQLQFVPFLLGTFIVMQLLRYLRFSKEVSSECGSNTTSFCAYTVKDLLTVVEKVWYAGSNFFYLYIAYEGVKFHGLSPRGFLPIVGIATFFTLLQWLLQDIFKVAKARNYVLSNTTTTDFVKYSFYDASYQFSAENIDMTYVTMGTILALFSR